jgi:hypothetical protein
MLTIGQKGTFHHPRGSARATVDWDRGAHRYDLIAEGIEFSETQQVPLLPGEDGRWFEPDDMAPPPPAAPPEEPVHLVPVQRIPPAWPAVAALVLSALGMGLSIVALLR